MSMLTKTTERNLETINERCKIMYWCGRPSHGGGALGFCPEKRTIYKRHHYELDSRVAYGDVIGERYVQQLRLQKKYMKWSKAEKQMFSPIRQNAEKS
jgi:hypothetical protein